jgi:hypothetical protein
MKPYFYKLHLGFCSISNQNNDKGNREVATENAIAAFTYAGNAMPDVCDMDTEFFVNFMAIKAV